jgi:hypothetical protein
MTSNVKPQNTVFGLQMASHAPLRSHDSVSYLHYMESWFQLMAELEILTGKITPSEMSEISVAGTRLGYLLFRKGKTKSRQRGIRITPAIRRVLDVLDKRAGGNRRLKKVKGGKGLTHAALYEAWSGAKNGGKPHYLDPYLPRHPFAACAHSICIDSHCVPCRMRDKSVMSRGMVCEVFIYYIGTLGRGPPHDS